MESSPIQSYEQQWFKSILNLIPEHLQSTPAMAETIQELFEEVQRDYHQSIKKSMGKSAQ